MKIMLRLTLLAAATMAVVPRSAPAQTGTIDSVTRRVEVLERTNVDLDRRVRELERLINGESSQAAPLVSTNKWRDVRNWRQLCRGMSMEQVRSLLGEPHSVDAMGAMATVWRWENRDGSFVSASVTFDGRTDKLSSWSEPRS